MRAAFYYPWYPETWTAGGKPVKGAASLGKYTSNLGIFQAHILMMRYARITAGIFSWWGPDSPYDKRVADMLKAAEGTPFKWCAYYEQEGFGNPPLAKLNTDLDYLRQYFIHPNYLHIQGKPVVFAYGDGTDDVAMAARWAQATNKAVFYSLKVFEGFRTITPQPSSWHQYAPDSPYADFLPWSVSVSPGFWYAPDPGPRLERDPARFEGDVKKMVTMNPQFQLITTFNEWGEGTAVEPEVSRGTVELDILRRNK